MDLDGKSQIPLLVHLQTTRLLRSSRSLRTAGRVDASYTLLSLLCIDIWCRAFLDGIRSVSAQGVEKGIASIACGVRRSGGATSATSGKSETMESRSLRATFMASIASVGQLMGTDNGCSSV